MCHFSNYLFHFSYKLQPLTRILKNDAPGANNCDRPTQLLLWIRGKEKRQPDWAASEVSLLLLSTSRPARLSRIPSRPGSNETRHGKKTWTARSRQRAPATSSRPAYGAINSSIAR